MCDDCLDGVWSSQCKTKAGWCTVVEDVDAVFCDFESIQEGFDAYGEALESVCVVSIRRNFREAITWEIWSDDSVFRTEKGNKVTELVRGCWEAMKEEDDGFVC